MPFGLLGFDIPGHHLDHFAVGCRELDGWQSYQFFVTGVHHRWNEIIRDHHASHVVLVPVSFILLPKTIDKDVVCNVGANHPVGVIGWHGQSLLHDHPVIQQVPNDFILHSGATVTTLVAGAASGASVVLPNGR